MVKTSARPTITNGLLYNVFHRKYTSTHNGQCTEERAACEASELIAEWLVLLDSCVSVLLMTLVGKFPTRVQNFHH